MNPVTCLFYIFLINLLDLNLNNAVESLTSRLVQFKKFDPPTFSLCNSNEWKTFHGQKLVSFFYFSNLCNMMYFTGSYANRPKNSVFWEQFFLIILKVNRN